MSAFTSFEMAETDFFSAAAMTGATCPFGAYSRDGNAGMLEFADTLAGPDGIRPRYRLESERQRLDEEIVDR